MQGQNWGSGGCRGFGGCGGFGGFCCCGNGVSLPAMLRLADCCVCLLCSIVGDLDVAVFAALFVGWKIVDGRPVPI